MSPLCPHITPSNHLYQGKQVGEGPVGIFRDSLKGSLRLKGRKKASLLACGSRFLKGKSLCKSVPKIVLKHRLIP